MEQLASLARDIKARPDAVLLNGILCWIAALAIVELLTPLRDDARLIVLGALAIAAFLAAALLGDLVARRRIVDACTPDPVRVAAADPFEIGVKESQLAQDRHRVRPNAARPWPTYVRRARDRRLRIELERRRRQLLVVVGPPAAGKSRAAFEAVADLFPDHKLLAPARDRLDEEPSALMHLLRTRIPLPRVQRALLARHQRWVLWLDDLADYLAGDHLTHAALSAWLHRHPSAIAIGTIDRDDYRLIQQSDSALTSAARDVLRNAKPIHLPATFSDREAQRASRWYRIDPDELERLPAHLLSVNAHANLWDDASAAGEPGAAVVSAAAHWRRAGLPSPVPPTALRRLAGRDGGGAELTERQFEAGLAWATRAERAIAPILAEVPGGYRIAGDLVQRIDDEHDGLIQPATVTALVDAVGEDTDALLVITRSLAARGQRGAARDVAERASETAFARAELRAVSAVIRDLADDRDVASEPAIVRQVWRARGGRWRSEPGAIAGPPTEQQQQASRRLGTRRPTKQWQDGVFDAQLPPPRPAWTVRFYRHEQLRRLLRLATLVLADAAAVLVGILAAVAIRALLRDESLATVPDVAGRYASVACTVAPLACGLAGLYRADAERARLTLIIRSLWGTAIVGLIALLLASGPSLHSGFTVWGSLVIAIAACWALRTAYDRISQAWVRRRRLQSRVLLIGSEDDVAACAPGLVRGSPRPMQVLGYLSDRHSSDADAFRLGGYADLDDAIEEHYVQRCIIVDARMPPDERVAIADRCHAHDVAVEALVGLPEFLQGVGRREEAELVLLTIEPLAPRQAAVYLKRAFDLAVLALTAWLTIPVYWTIKLLVKRESPGEPTILRPLRPGLGDRGTSDRGMFEMLRFRTRSDVGAELGERGARGSTGAPPGRLGRFLETSGLDELPQLINVLRGEMSLVGPRPLPLFEYEHLPAEYQRRNLALPGITGLWQLSRRGGLSGRDLIEMDLIYLRDWSVTLDLSILLQTAVVVARNRPRSAIRFDDRSHAEHTGQSVADAPDAVPYGSSRTPSATSRATS